MVLSTAWRCPDNANKYIAGGGKLPAFFFCDDYELLQPRVEQRTLEMLRSGCLSLVAFRLHSFRCTSAACFSGCFHLQ